MNQTLLIKCVAGLALLLAVMTLAILHMIDGNVAVDAIKWVGTTFLAGAAVLGAATAIAQGNVASSALMSTPVTGPKASVGSLSHAMLAAVARGKPVSKALPALFLPSTSSSGSVDVDTTEASVSALVKDDSAATPIDGQLRRERTPVPPADTPKV